MIEKIKKLKTRIWEWINKIKKVIQEFTISYFSILKKNFLAISFILIIAFCILLHWKFDDMAIRIAGLIVCIIILIPILHIISGKYDKKSQNISTIIVIYITTASFITYLFCSHFQIPAGLIVGSVDAWIGFSGSIIGGAITLFVLYITLDNQSQEQKKSHYYKFLPIIQALPLYHRTSEGHKKFSDTQTLLDSIIYNPQSESTDFLSLPSCVLKNIGKDIATNIKIKNITILGFIDRQEDAIEFANEDIDLDLSLSIVSNRPEFYSQISFTVPVIKDKVKKLETDFFVNNNVRNGNFKGNFHINISLEFLNSYGLVVTQSIKIHSVGYNVETLNSKRMWNIDDEDFIAELKINSNPNY